MPEVLNKATGKREYMLDADAAASVQEGTHEMPSGERIAIQTEFDDVRSVSGERLQHHLDLGSRAGEQAAVAERVEHFRLQDKHDTLGQEIITGLEGVARGATFGLSDAALVGLGADAENIKNRAAVNDSIALGSELVGAIAPSFFTGGAGAAGTVARALPSGALAARAGALGTRLGGGLKAAVVAGGLEGSVFGAGQAVSSLALSNEALTAEAVFSEVGTAALLGAGFGAAGGALGVGLEKGVTSMAKIGGKVKDRLVKKAVPGLDITSKKGKALYKSLRSSTDDFDEIVERSVAKARDRSATGFKFSASDDLAETSFGTLRKQKSDALDYAQAAGGKLPANVKKATAKVEAAEAKITKLLSNKKGSLDFGKASSLNQKSMGSLGKAYDDLNTSVAKLSDEIGVPFQAARSPVDSGIVQKLDGIDDLAKAAQDAQGAFRKKLGKKGIDGLADQTPEQAMATVQALQDATDKASVLARQLGGKEADRLSSISDDITGAISGASDKKLPEVAELALALGIEEAIIPDVDGPADELLKLYLATRIVGRYGGAGGLASKVLGKAAGKVPGASKVAAMADGFVTDTMGTLASTTGKSMERIGKGLEKTLRGTAKAVKRSSPLTTTVLSEVSYGDSEGKKKPRSKLEAFGQRSEELSAAISNLPATREKVSARLDGLRQVTPGVADRTVEHTMASLQFLHDRMPKDPGVLQRFGRSKWRPTDGQLDKFARYATAVKDPAGIIERFGEFKMTREDAEVMQTLYPAHYREAQMWIMDNLEQLAEKSTWEQRVQMSTFMNTPADPIVAKGAVWQGHFAAAQQEGQQPAPRSNIVGTNTESETAAQQLQEIIK